MFNKLNKTLNNSINKNQTEYNTIKELNKDIGNDKKEYDFNKEFKPANLSEKTPTINLSAISFEKRKSLRWPGCKILKLPEIKTVFIKNFLRYFTIKLLGIFKK